MRSEYVKLSSAEKSYGYRHLLHMQLEFLDVLKRLGSFKKLRADELVLKVTLKNKIGEALVAIDKLEKLLPKTRYKPESVRQQEEKEDEEELTLEKEIERVRKKLEVLRKGV